MSDPTWVAVCRYEDLDAEHGVAVLVHGRGVAVFRSAEGRVLAVANRDPFSRASALSRGLVGTSGGVTYVSCPTHLQTFDLDTGVCLEDPQVRISTYDVRVRNAMVEVGARRRG
ncbi:nitrite reductase small subunit [Marmoricola endophyticus]|uniref:Nitrite reductase small subunit n=1 Tax=Marmoricola endophyticus TaxID=2040280 RepID=A0A917F6V1_9ACTN|nr:nitrite reductase small subunit NirD [Marmoricola endophyticus]GGF52061.1 nitrite reductase small subunit [Marmoricola endophyticus]